MILIRCLKYVLFVFAFIIGTPLVALADPINIVPYASLTGTGLVTFQDVPGGLGAGTNYDVILVSGGVSFAERFMGQTLSFSGDFDVLSGIPTGPLTLQPGAPNRNVGVLTFSSGNNAGHGLGPLGFPNFDALGEGSLAALFPTDQFELGFRIVGTNGGSATVNFFRSNGTLIDTKVLSGLTDGLFGFRRDGNIMDIAGISIHNDDPAGIGYDDIRYHVAAVPEPSTLSLLGLGALALVLSRKKGSITLPGRILIT